MTIAFVGASGYGNVGDDMYPFILKRFLASHDLLFFNSDLPKALPHIDLMVIGGGGVVYNNSDEPSINYSPHFRKMQFYLDHALVHDIPFAFLSCGFQIRPDFLDRKLETLTLWIPYLEAALFASFRSKSCLSLFQQLTGRDDGCYFPDLGYLNYHQQGCQPRHVLPTKYAVIVPSGEMKPSNEHFMHQVRLLESSGCQPVWVQMGADCDDKRHFEEIAITHPEWMTIRGASCSEISAIIAGAKFVISGRFHGMVFARTNGVPFYVPPAAPYKLMVEDWHTDSSEAFGHIELISRHLKLL